MTVVDDIKSRLDILEVVSGKVTLQRSGQSYKANCPFHQERTPSFYVFPDRQSWRCFGACATGGDVFSFVMKSENLEFGEALRSLAQQTGVALPSQQRRTEQQTAFDLNEAAKAYFQQRLASSQGAETRAYLERRGLERETVVQFELGLSPDDGESMKNHLASRGFSPEQMAQAGLVSGGDNGRYRDLFRHRLIIPIRNGQGELAGFGGRALDDSNPKYLNSPRTPIFDKGRILYALHLARDTARQQGMVVVEGYMDAIMAHQHGYRNVVASMGTALTEAQVAEVRRVTGDIIMALDADAAGQQATLRSLESSWKVFQTQAVGRVQSITINHRQEGQSLRVAALPDGLDPDEVIRQSPEQWGQLIEHAKPLFEFLLPALSAQVDITTPQGKSWVAQQLLDFIAAVSDPIVQDHYFQQLAHHLRVSEETLRASMGRLSRQPGRGNPAATRRAPAAALPGSGRNPGGNSEHAGSDSAFTHLENDPIEDHCLARILQRPEVYELLPALLPEYFQQPANREIVTLILSAQDDGFDDVAVEWIRQTVGEELTPHLEQLLGKSLPPSEPGKRVEEMAQVVFRLEERYLRGLKTEEAMRFSELNTPGPPEDADGVDADGGGLPSRLPGDGMENILLEINSRIRDNETARGNWRAGTVNQG